MSNYQPTNPVWRNGFSTGLNCNASFIVEKKVPPQNIPMGECSTYLGGVVHTFVGFKTHPVAVEFVTATKYEE